VPTGVGSLESKTSGSLVLFGAAAYLAFSFSCLAFNANLASSTSSGTALQIWAEALVVVVLGVALVVSGALIGLDRWPSYAGALGAFASILGALLIISYYLTAASVGINNASAGASASLIDIGTIIALFVGFPIGFMGSFGGLWKAEQDNAVSA